MRKLVRVSEVLPNVTIRTSDGAGGSICPTCKGLGRLRIDVPCGHPHFGKDVACVCLERQLRQQHQAKLVALSEQFGFQRAQVFATFRQQVKGTQDAYQQAAEMTLHLTTWAGQREQAHKVGDMSGPPQEWLVLMGPVGTGKTHLAMAVANGCIDADAGISTLFVTVPDLLDSLRATFEAEAKVGYEEVFAQLRTAEVLVLDDLGAQHSSSWADEKLYQLLNYRYNQGCPTVITLNTSAWTRLDERLRSRMQDARLVRLVELVDTQDFRIHQGKHPVKRRA